jgi:hypothetical protein
VPFNSAALLCIVPYTIPTGQLISPWYVISYIYVGAVELIPGYCTALHCTKLTAIPGCACEVPTVLYFNTRYLYCTAQGKHLYGKIIGQKKGAFKTLGIGYRRRKILAGNISHPNSSSRGNRGSRRT